MVKIKVTSIGKGNYLKANIELKLKEQCFQSWASSSQGGWWHHFMLWHQWTSELFCFRQNDLWNASFQTRPNFLPAVDKAKLLVGVDTFPTPGSALILAIPLCAETTHIAPFQNYWGFVGWSGEQRSRIRKGCFGGLRNRISLPPKYQLFSQAAVLLWKRDN